MHVRFSLMAKLREQKEIKQDKNTLQGSNNSEIIAIFYLRVKEMFKVIP